MKKIIILAFLICLMALSTAALVQYTGQPQMPYILYGHVEWNNQMLSGTRVQITNQATGYVETVLTDSYGYWQTEAGNWFTTSANRPPFVKYIEGVVNGDMVEVKTLDGCGTADVCSKTFMVGSDGYKEWAVVDLDLTGTLSCPPCNCNCGGGGGGGGCGYTEPMCREKYPCVECETKVCPNPVYTESNCRTLFPCEGDATPICPVQPECKVCEEKVCPICPEPTSPLGAVIAAIITALIGGGVVYITLSKTNKVKIKRVNGVDEVWHQHPNISGYHSINTIHKVEPHKKGELVPDYIKVDNKWSYVG